MNLTVNSQALAKELRLLNKVIPSKPAIPILSHVLLRAEETLMLDVTDLEVGLSTTCHSQIHAPGRIALPAAHLLAMVEQFTDEDVSITLDKTQARVKCGAFKSRIQAHSADDFPQLPHPEGTASVMNMAAFHELIARTRYAVNASNAKHILQGTLLTLTGNAAAMVATDGKRLAMATAPQEGDAATVIVPAKALDLLAAQSADGDLELTVGDRHLFFKVGERLLLSRTIDGTFPKYEHIIPRENDKVVTVGRAVLAAALRRVRLASAEGRAVYLSMSADSIGLSSSSAEAGSAEELVSATYSAEDLRVCVNGDFLLNFLEAAKGQSVSLAFKDAKGAMLLLDGEDHIGVISLMR